MLPARPPLLPPVSPTQLLQHQHQLQQQKHQHFDHHAHHHNHRAVAGLPPRPVLIHQQQPWQPTDPRLSRRSPSSLSSLAAAAAAAATDGVGSHHHLTMPTPPESLSPADCVGASAEAAAAAAQLLALNHTTSSSSSSSLGMWPAQEATSTPPMPPPFLSASMYPEDSDYRYGHLGDQEEDDDGDIGSASCSDADDLEIDSYVPPPRTLFDTALVASTDDLVERSPSPLLMGGGGRDESESPALRIGNSDGNDDEDDEEQQDLPPIGPDGLASRPTNPRKPCTDAEVAALATFSFMDECWYQNSKLGLAEDAMELPCACRYRPGASIFFFCINRLSR
ncbi:hypothetical protein BC828DRAFT_407404 [Blastocladiella britannica]|nr:hypothetical protein BC828DRAFT_407404 [Blastocladiella britannica]